MINAIELIASVCSILHGATCKNVTMTFAADQVSHFECMAYGQIALADWSASHPNWTIARWRCAVAGQTAGL